MTNLRKKKYSSGEATQFMSRKSALKKLQLSLKDFRRLCIIKGIYPREPRNRKRAQKGDTGIKTLYAKKDIQFLLHEPLIYKMREQNVYSKKVGKIKAMRNFKLMKRYMKKFPGLKLDHVVKERYPTFVDALRDLDDCLTLCFLFSTFPSISHIPRHQSDLCKRLTVEFMHAVIEAKALRKVFISIKGYYYQAEIKGVTVNWVVPHHFSFQPQTKDEVDFKIMSTFVDFYTIMLGFVNFRLYHELNLFYPPKFIANVEQNRTLVDEKTYVAERIAALNVPLKKSVTSNDTEEVEIDSFPSEGDDPEKAEQIRIEAEKIKKLKTLFKGLKFYVNREVPREPLVFIIRCFGGEVSWDSLLFVGATFDEQNESITHQIVDRPSIDKKFISRFYVQPQWVFDCVNARELLPESKYFIGAVLPPHLSPFSDDIRKEEYIPPEEKALRDPSLIETKEKSDESEEGSDDEEEEDEEENEEDGEEKISDDEDEDEAENDEEVDKEKLRKKMLKKMAVKPGEKFEEVPWAQKRQERQEYRLREKMIHKKHKNLYKSMMEGRKKRAKEIWLLRKKRRLHDQSVKEEKKLKKKEQKSKES